MKKEHLVLCVIVPLALISCTIEKPTEPQKEIVFAAEVKTVGTKATLVNTVAQMGSVLGAFSVESYCEGALQFSDKVSYASGEWKSASSHGWVKDKNMEFVAVAPDASIVMSKSYAPATKTLTLYCANGSDMSAQKDLMCGYYCGQGDGEVAPIHFSHLLSAIRFTLEDTRRDYTLKSISVEDVCPTGVCTINFPNSDGSSPSVSWGSQTGSQTISYTPGTVPSPGQLITEEAIMVLPQTFGSTSTAKIKATVTAGGVDKTIAYALKNSEFEPGKTYTFSMNLSKESIVLESAVETWYLTNSSFNGDSAVDLSANGTASANCYIIPLESSGYYKFPAVKGNSSTSVGDAKTAKVIWETVNTGTAPAEATIVTNADVRNGWVYIYSTGLTAGNALVAVYDGEDAYGNPSGNILWSWHIWKTATPADEAYANDAGSLMDRNLGALAKTGNLSTGMMYQWGRKDPLPGPSSTSANALMAVAGTATTFVGRTTVLEGGTALNYSIKNPTAYIYNNSGDVGDWYSNSANQGDDRWGNNKTIYDPCPAGYKVPQGGRLAEGGFFAIAMGRESGIAYGETGGSIVYHSNNGVDFPLQSGQTFFPLSGLILGQGIFNVGHDGLYWTDCPGGFNGNPLTWTPKYAVDMNFNSSQANPTLASSRDAGCPVRCMKGETAIEYTYNTPTVSETSISAPHFGGEDTFTVISTKTHASSTVGAAWKLQYSTDGGSNWTDGVPSWISAAVDGKDMTTGVGSTTGEVVTIKMAASTGGSEGTSSDVDAVHTQNLKNATPKTDFDLSTINVATGATCLQTSANCYVVQASGTYRFPLAYGSALLNGSTNDAAYKTNNGVDGNMTLGYLRGQKSNNIISSPWVMTDQGSGTYSAALLWQDAQNLVTNVALDDNYMTFSVSQSTIRQGNALLALMKGGTVVWSWHIWVTDYDLTESGQMTITRSGQTSRTIDFMRCNLGNCDGGAGTVTNHAQRSIKLRIQQLSASGKQSSAIDAVQNAGADVKRAGTFNNPYYQWGRKDPFIPSNGTDANKTVYTGSTSLPAFAYSSNTSGGYTIHHGIDMPTTMLHVKNATYDWLGPFNCAYKNYWDISLNTDYNKNLDYSQWRSTVKSVYDPCPVGFKLPNGYTVWWNDRTSFTKTLDSSTTPASIIVNSSDYLVFPLVGYRPWNSGNMSSSGTLGLYWSSATGSSERARSIWMQNNGTYILGDIEKSCGLSVRPVKE